MAGEEETGITVQPGVYSSKQLDHLGLVAGMYDELGIGNLIDKLIAQDGEKRIVSIGQAVKAMVMNGLGFANRTLYLTELFFRDKPIERLIGEGIEAKHLNDDMLGRALDAIWEYGPSKLYPQLAAQAVKRLGLLCHFGHMDSTGFHVNGQYNSNEEEVEPGVIHITKGYSRDHRPDLNQVVLQLVSERQAGIPVLMQALNGNNSDQESFREMVNEFAQQMRGDFGIEYLIADSALYTAENLKSMSALWWITRVPETLNLACDVIEVLAPELMKNQSQSAFRSLETEYGGVKQRWVIVFSPQAYQRACKTIDRQCYKQSHAELKSFTQLCKQKFACEADARQMLTAFEKTLKLNFISDTQIIAIPRFTSKGRPTQGRLPDHFDYHIEGAIASRLKERVRRLQRQSCFILASNQLNCESLSNEQLIAAYKDQQQVEGAFRFLKDPLFMASTLFLNSPKRIMALMMIMTLSLLVYAALEHRIRLGLKTQNVTFPNQKRQLVSNPTARWIFQFFSGIHVLTIQHAREFVLNLNDHQIALLNLLGQHYVKLYS